MKPTAKQGAGSTDVSGAVSMYDGAAPYNDTYLIVSSLDASVAYRAKVDVSSGHYNISKVPTGANLEFVFLRGSEYVYEDEDPTNVIARFVKTIPELSGENFTFDFGNNGESIDDEAPSRGLPKLLSQGKVVVTPPEHGDPLPPVPPAKPEAEVPVVRTPDPELPPPVRSLVSGIAEGSLIKGSGLSIYRVERGKLRHIKYEATFTHFHYDWGAVKVVADDVIENAPLGSGIVLPEETLIKGPGPAVYLWRHGSLHHIKYDATFHYYKYDWGKVLTTNQPAVDEFPKGDEIVIPSGIVLRAAGYPHVYKWDGVQKHWIENEYTLGKLGFTQEKVIIWSAASVTELPSGGSINMQQPAPPAAPADKPGYVPGRPPTPASGSWNQYIQVSGMWSNKTTSRWSMKNTANITLRVSLWVKRRDGDWEKQSDGSIIKPGETSNDRGMWSLGANADAQAYVCAEPPGQYSCDNVKPS